MKSAFATLSTQIIGTMLARLRISIFYDAQRVLANRKRIAIISGLFVAGTVLLFSGLLLAAIDSAWQYDSQGFIAWNAMEGLAAGLTALALAMLISARYAIPLREVSQPDLTEALHQLGLPKIIDDFLERIQKKSEAPAPSVAPQMADMLRYDNESPAAH